ncbi:MAG TPA: hypothetical protein VKP64_03130 [Mycobacteriales bacterium]|nr:hypothetical protein [Mycobacteriales bacterium]
MGARWLEVAPEHLDAGTVVWTLGRVVDRSRLPKPRVVVRFDLTGHVTPRRYWLVLTRDDSEVCVTPPGYDEDLVVTTDTRWLTAWHMGWVPLGVAQRTGHLVVEGPPAMVRTFREWGRSSPFAGVRPAVDQPLLAPAVTR